MDIVACVTFSNSSVVDRVDEIRFDVPVLLSGCRIVGTAENPHPDLLHFQGCSSPASFSLDLFCSVLPPGPPRFVRLCDPVAYRQGAHAGKDWSKPVWSDHVVLRGSYQTLSLLLYSTRPSLSPPPPPAPVVEPRPLDALLSERPAAVYALSEAGKAALAQGLEGAAALREASAGLGMGCGGYEVEEQEVQMALRGLRHLPFPEGALAAARLVCAPAKGCYWFVVGGGLGAVARGLQQHCSVAEAVGVLEVACCHLFACQALLGWWSPTGPGVKGSAAYRLLLSLLLTPACPPSLARLTAALLHKLRALHVAALIHSMAEEASLRLYPLAEAVEQVEAEVGCEGVVALLEEVRLLPLLSALLCHPGAVGRAGYKALSAAAHRLLLSLSASPAGLLLVGREWVAHSFGAAHKAPPQRYLRALQGHGVFCTPQQLGVTLGQQQRALETAERVVAAGGEGAEALLSMARDEAGRQAVVAALALPQVAQCLVRMRGCGGGWRVEQLLLLLSEDTLPHSLPLPPAQAVYRKEGLGGLLDRLGQLVEAVVGGGGPLSVTELRGCLWVCVHLCACPHTASALYVEGALPPLHTLLTYCSGKRSKAALLAPLLLLLLAMVRRLQGAEVEYRNSRLVETLLALLPTLSCPLPTEEEEGGVGVERRLLSPLLACWVQSGWTPALLPRLLPPSLPPTHAWGTLELLGASLCPSLLDCHLECSAEALGSGVALSSGPLPALQPHSANIARLMAHLPQALPAVRATCQRFLLRAWCSAEEVGRGVTSHLLSLLGLVGEDSTQTAPSLLSLLTDAACHPGARALLLEEKAEEVVQRLPPSAFLSAPAALLLASLHDGEGGRQKAPTARWLKRKRADGPPPPPLLAWECSAVQSVVEGNKRAAAAPAVAPTVAPAVAPAVALGVREGVRGRKSFSGRGLEEFGRAPSIRVDHFMARQRQPGAPPLVAAKEQHEHPPPPLVPHPPLQPRPAWGPAPPSHPRPIAAPPTTLPAEAIQALLSDPGKLAEFLEQNPSLMAVLQAQIGA